GVGEEAKRGRRVEPFATLPQQPLEPHDGLDLVGRRIEPDDDVAAPERQALEDREQILMLFLPGTVWLYARLEMARRAERRLPVAERIEQRARDRRQFGGGHHFG